MKTENVGWNLTMKQMVKNWRKGKQDRIRKWNESHKKKVRAQPKKKEKEFIFHTKYRWKCLLVGHLAIDIGYDNKAGYPVYYNENDDLYVLKTGISYQRKTIEPMINFVNKPPEKELFDFSKYCSEQEEPNFHEQ